MPGLPCARSPRQRWRGSRASGRPRQATAVPPRPAAGRRRPRPAPSQSTAQQRALATHPITSMSCGHTHPTHCTDCQPNNGAKEAPRSHIIASLHVLQQRSSSDRSSSLALLFSEVIQAGPSTQANIALDPRLSNLINVLFYLNRNRFLPPQQNRSRRGVMADRRKQTADRQR